MTYNPAFDIKKPNFEVDLIFGELGEDLIRTFVANICAGNIEVKTDRYRNGRMVIETHQHRFKPDCPQTSEPYWKLSGINVTEADWWVYVFNIEGSFIIVKVERLKKFLRLNKFRYNEETKRLFAANSDNPTKGWIVEPSQVIDLLVNPAYD